MNTLLTSSLVLVATSLIPGQDMVAVDWSGQVYALDSDAGSLRLLGQGLAGQDATALGPNGTIWSTHRSGANPNLVYSLTTIQPATGTATIVHSGGRDIRAMAGDGTTTLWCIVNGSSDELHRVDTVTGTFTKIGSTGRNNLEGLAFHQGKLFAWETGSGLLTIDPTTGRTTDVDPRVGGGGGSVIRFLASRADGKLIGGKSDLYEIDPATGVYTRIATLGASVDLRGAEEWYGTARPYGQGCSGASGLVTLQVAGTLRPAGTLQATSGNHAAGATGAMVLGLSRTTYQGASLPLNLDPMLGTVGCSMLASMDTLAWGVTTRSPPAALTFQFTIPASAAGLALHVQHATFESVPGGMSWSNGVTLHIGY